jgi:hypothetical protein
VSDNTQRFSGHAADYTQYRERYDAAILLPRLREWCGLTVTWLIGDIGAGTGMLADVFLANGNHVLAIEPNEDMRKTCASLHPDTGSLTILDGTAEATTLAALSVDMVCAGRAFHWFDVDLAMGILKLDGWVVSVAFGRAPDGSDANLAIETLLRGFTENRSSTREAYAKYARLSEFLVRDFHHEEIEGTMHLTQTELFGLLRSLSHAPLPGDPRFPEFERGTHQIFAQHAVGGNISLATRYWMTVGRL